MMRIHWFEIHEQGWVPESLRSATTDYLAHVEDVGKVYDPVIPVLAEAITRSGAGRVVDLCSGGAGPWGRLQGLVSEAMGTPLTVLLTDLNPNRQAFEHLAGKLGDSIQFVDTPVNVLDVPEELDGFRTLFSSFHHFRPRECVQILEDAVAKGEGIALVEVTHRSLLGILPMLIVPLIVLLVTPFIRPFRWSRLFWTYLVPLAPLIIVVDGMVSCLRTYTVDELEAFAAEAGGDGYSWQTGAVRVKGMPVPMTYLVGVPSGGSAVE